MGERRARRRDQTGGATLLELHRSRAAVVKHHATVGTAGSRAEQHERGVALLRNAAAEKRHAVE
eukprot:5079275-Prymnesium_polylepis.3